MQSVDQVGWLADRTRTATRGTVHHYALARSQRPVTSHCQIIYMRRFRRRSCSDTRRIGVEIDVGVVRAKTSFDCAVLWLGDVADCRAIAL